MIKDKIMQSILHRANERGHADHGWLNAHHSFSFANWYDPARIHFGMLRVLNDDIVAPGKGFGMHPHNDMEIITIILQGELEHRDNMGNGSVIKRGDVQVMSAGTGVLHSEFNPSSDNETSLFQLWVFPKEKGIKPRYDQKSFSEFDRINSFQTIASGFENDDALYIHQDARISLASPAAGAILKYKMEKKEHGAYVMLIDGKIKIDCKTLEKRDAIGISSTEEFEIHVLEKSEILLVEIPMN